ncbi:MAG: GNAT family N-acetyltransferase [Verrucomicrobiales bacterium]
MTITSVSPTDAEARSLISELDAEIAKCYPGSPINGIDVDEFLRSGGYFVVAKEGSAVLGCGAFRPVGESCAEVKRMFVRPHARKRGIALDKFFGGAQPAIITEAKKKRRRAVYREPASVDSEVPAGKREKREQHSAKNRRSSKRRRFHKGHVQHLKWRAQSILLIAGSARAFALPKNVLGSRIDGIAQKMQPLEPAGRFYLVRSPGDAERDCWFHSLSLHDWIG